MSGEAAFVEAERVPTTSDDEIISLFRRRKERDYGLIEAALEQAEREVQSLRQSSDDTAVRRLAGRIDKIRRDLDEVRKTDFFDSAPGVALEGRIARARAALGTLKADGRGAAPAAVIPPRSKEAYRSRLWLTRERPFVDRMASAWLIRRFVDPEAAFGFIGEGGTAPRDREGVVFDTAGGEFTHVGELCTFEVLLRSFDLRSPALAAVARVVHDLDLEAERSRAPEAAGVREILAGIRRSARDDAEALERGIAVFEALHAAKDR